MRKKIAIELFTTIVVIGVVALAQRPAARQALVMRTAHAARRFCQAQADFWQTMATASAQAYQKARL